MLNVESANTQQYVEVSTYHRNEMILRNNEVHWYCYSGGYIDTIFNDEWILDDSLSSAYLRGVVYRVRRRVRCLAFLRDRVALLEAQQRWGGRRWVSARTEVGQPGQGEHTSEAGSDWTVMTGTFGKRSGNYKTAGVYGVWTDNSSRDRWLTGLRTDFPQYNGSSWRQGLPMHKWSDRY